MAKRYRQRKRRHRRRVQRYLRLGACLLICLLLAFIAMKCFGWGPFQDGYTEKVGQEMDAARPEIETKLLTVNPYSRPGTKIGQIHNIVLHYTANPGTTAMQNRNYFEGLKDSHITKASSHFVVGIQGEIVQCIPMNEVSFASNDRNGDTISVETCHMTADGSYTQETYDSMVALATWLCMKFDLDEQDIIRHYDVTGKNCPKYFVENEEAWVTFKADVKAALEEK
ncbi:MAG: peptidoglycan recognition family protein [Faecalimonas sp.]|nr:peptidoglycan recognition family protein [Faecalimonas sp.]